MTDDLIDSQPRETFVAGGDAPNVLDADAQAWRALESCLGRDPVAAWTLTKITHAFQQLGQIEWTATFERDPDFPVPPVTPRQMTDEELDAAVADAKGATAAAGKRPRS